MVYFKKIDGKKQIGKRMVATFFCFISSILSSCFPLLDWRNPTLLDYQPPILVDWNVVSSNQIELLFDEAVEGVKAVDGVDSISEGEKLILSFEESMKPGHLYKLPLSLQDKYRNRLELILSYYGYNPHVAQLVLSEVRLQGTKNRPAMVEMKVLKAGSLAGITFYKGSPVNYDFFYVFPDVSVEQGDWILLHLAPEGIPQEINEVKNKKQSGGKEALDTAWDFWLKKKEGLSSSFGLLTVSSSFKGEVQDLLLYSKPVPSKKEGYGGFGSLSSQLRAEWAVKVGQWSVSEEPISPTDCVDPSFSTATRTLCRNRRCEDSNSVSDWYVVANGESTMGAANSEKKYSP